MNKNARVVYGSEKAADAAVSRTDTLLRQNARSALQERQSMNRNKVVVDRTKL